MTETGADAEVSRAERARRIRARLVELSHRAGSPHLGSSLSCVDILVAAYFGPLVIDPARPQAPHRDRVILSKGHAAPALYLTLAERGFFGRELLAEFNADGGRLPEQPAPGCVPGLEAATGSLGHGLSLGLGMAMADRIRPRGDRRHRVVVVMSDGECNEGQVWEAAMLAPAHDLGNLCTIVDFNRWQATARSDEVMALSPLADKFASFGWRTAEIDGHDVEALTRALERFARDPSGEAGGTPLAIVAHTTKGRGVSFMEDDNNWHYRIPTAAEVVEAWIELGQDPANIEPTATAE